MRGSTMAIRRDRLVLTAGFLVLVAVAGCDPCRENRARIAELESSLSDSERQRTELEESLAALRAENDTLAARLTELGENVDALRAESSSLSTSLADAERERDELRAREEAARARLATFRSMLERFRAMMESGRLRVRVVRNRMVVELPNNVLFDSGEAELREEGQATLLEVVAVLREIEGRQFQVAGHTDSVPIRSHTFASNWELSAERAVHVARFMVEQGMLAPDRISAAGYADTQPLETNDTEEGRARNRRIEIVLLPNLDELPDLSALTDATAGS